MTEIFVNTAKKVKVSKLNIGDWFEEDGSICVLVDDTTDKAKALAIVDKEIDINNRRPFTVVTGTVIPIKKVKIDLEY